MSVFVVKTIIEKFSNVIPLSVLVTDESTELTAENSPYMPWEDFHLFNDGPNSVYIAVNDDVVAKETPLRKGESLRVNMGGRLINKIILVCDDGETASVRMFAKS